MVTESQWTKAWKDSFLKPDIRYEPYTKEGGTVILDRRGTHHGWLARMAGNTELDCTDWTEHESEQAAREYLFTLYADEGGGK